MDFLRPLACAAAAACLASAPTRAQCFDWSGDFVGSGASGSVLAQLVHDDGSGPVLYIGGRFTSVADAAAQHVARWDGTQWSELGSGIDETNADVRALAMFDDGGGPELCAGGRFGSVNGVTANGVAKWNGVSWQPFGSGFTWNTQLATVTALAAHDDGSGPALYAGGAFTHAGGVAVTNLARWNGTSWSRVGTNMTASLLNALAVFDDGSGPELYAGGTFQLQGVSGNRFLVHWDGTAWSPVNGPSASVTALAPMDGIVGPGPSLIVGQSSFPGSGKWDGTTWTPLGTGTLPTAFTAFDDGVNGRRLYCSGSSSTIHLQVWNGSAWSSVFPLGTFDAAVRSLTTFDDGGGERMFIGGDFTLAAGQPADALVSWNGAQLTPISTPTGVDGEVFGLGVWDNGSGPELYTGGNFATAAGAPAIGMARWNGTQWLNAGTNMPPSSVVHDFLTWDDGNGPALYAAGNFNLINGATIRKVARWNGSAWSPLGSGPTQGGDAAVKALALYDDGSGAGEALYATGRWQGGFNKIAKWNGTTWSGLSSGLSYEATSLAVYTSGGVARLYVGGNFLMAGGISAKRIAAWNGTNWSALGSGVDSWVNALAEFDDGSGSALYVGGWFSVAGGIPASYIARWNGSTWSTVGGGFDGAVFALEVYDDGTGPALYAGGDFAHAGGQPAAHVARWNGTAWSALGAGVDGRVEAFVEFDDGSGPALYIGGAFNAAAGNVSRFVARWGRACTCPPFAYCTAGTSSNGCVPSIGGTGTPSASGAGSFVVAASNVEGQKTGLLFYGISGATSAPWGATTSTLCVKPPQQRTGQSSSGGTSGLCDGAFVLDFNAYLASHPTSLGQPFSAGDTVRMQGWYRDPPNPKTTSLTDALEFYLCP